MAIATGTALALGAAGSAAAGMYSANKASKTAGRAADQQTALQREVYDETTQRFQPFYGAGTNALQGFLSEMGLGEAPEGYTGYEQSPMAQYLLGQARESVPTNAAAVGGRYSGATLQALNDRNRDIIGADQSQYMNRLFGLGQMGQNAAGNMGAAGTNFANAGSSAIGNAAGMQANAQMMGGQNIQQGISDMAGIYGYMNPLQSYGQSNMMAGQAPMQSPRPMARPF